MLVAMSPELLKLVREPAHAQLATLMLNPRRT
jgi:hypothetical protein